jgi:hypothetical protein
MQSISGDACRLGLDNGRNASAAPMDLIAKYGAVRSICPDPRPANPCGLAAGCEALAEFAGDR